MVSQRISRTRTHMVVAQIKNCVEKRNKTEVAQFLPMSVEIGLHFMCPVFAVTSWSIIPYLNIHIAKKSKVTLSSNVQSAT